MYTEYSRGELWTRFVSGEGRRHLEPHAGGYSIINLYSYSEVHLLDFFKNLNILSMHGTRNV